MKFFSGAVNNDSAAHPLLYTEPTPSPAARSTQVIGSITPLPNYGTHAQSRENASSTTPLRSSSDGALLDRRAGPSSAMHDSAPALLGMEDTPTVDTVVSDKKPWQDFCWRSYLYLSGHSLAASVFFFAVKMLPPSGSIYASDDEFTESLNNIGFQALYGVAAIAWTVAAIKLAQQVSDARGVDLPVEDPFHGFKKHSITYLLAGPLSMIPTDAIYRVFPPSGTVDATTGLAQINNNFWNGALNNASFMLAILAIEGAFKLAERGQAPDSQDKPTSELIISGQDFVDQTATIKADELDETNQAEFPEVASDNSFLDIPPGDTAPTYQQRIEDDALSSNSSLSKRTRADDDAITALLRVSLGFVIGGGVSAIASVPLMKWLPQTGMPGARDGLKQIAIDIVSQTLNLATTVIGGGVPAELAIQALDKYRQGNDSAEEKAPEKVLVPDEAV